MLKSLFLILLYSVVLNSTFYENNLCVPMQSNVHSEYEQFNNRNNQSTNYQYQQQKIYTSSQKRMKYYGGSYSTENGSAISTNTYNEISTANIALASKPTTKEYTCPMCGGTGYINDNGDGELVTATWWRQTTGNAGDGTYCDGVTAYHDPCDADWSETGGTYHHDGKRVCPQCGGTGKVTGRRQPSVISGWTQWYGESWSHLYHDDDGDGHCDEHYWHLQTPVGEPPILAFILFLGIYTIITYKKD